MTLLGRIAGRAARGAGAVSLIALAVGVATGAEGGARRDEGATGSIVRADAGDDQIGLVGRGITLNGGGSEPRGATFRWFLLSGPRIDQASQDGRYYSFTPTAPGTYRLGLVVAACRGDVAVVSEIDEVVVTVGEDQSALVGGVGVGGAPAAAAAAIDQVLAGPGAAAGRATLEQAAGALDAIADRAPLYASFADLGAELSRRLDAVIPTDPEWRRYWSDAVFGPLTEDVVVEMRRAGLDLRSPRGRDQPLEEAQREHLAKLLASYARDFRARAHVR